MKNACHGHARTQQTSPPSVLVLGSSATSRSQPSPAHRSHSSAPTVLEKHQQPRCRMGVCTQGFLQRRHVAPATPRSIGSINTMKGCLQLLLVVRSRRVEACAHITQTHVSGCMSHGVAFETGAGELTQAAERLCGHRSEAAASCSSMHRCEVTASLLAPHVVNSGRALFCSTSTAAAPDLPVARRGCAVVRLVCRR